VKLDVPGGPVDLRRLLLVVVLPLACLGVLAIIFVPSSLLMLAATLLLVLPAAFLVIDRPTLIFYLLIIILFSNLDVYAPFRLYRFVLLLTAAAFALALANGRRIVSHHPFMIALIAAFLILAFQSLSVARDFTVGMRKLQWVLKLLAAVAIIAQFTRDRREFRRFLLVMATGILLADFLPFIIHPPSKFASLSLLWGQGVVRYEGFVFEPNVFAMYQIFLIPLLVFFTSAYRKPPVARPFFIAAILGSVAVLMLSFSRGGFVGFMLILVMIIVLERKNKPVFLLGLGLLVAGAILLPAVYLTRVQSMVNIASRGTSDVAVLTRLQTMKVALKLGVEHPLLGVGMDNFLPRAVNYVPYRLVVHNAFLQVFSEMGIIQLAIFVGIIAYNFRIATRLMKRSADPESAQLGRALLIQQAGMVATVLFLPGAYEMIFWFTLALPAIGEYAYRPGAEGSGGALEGASGRK
jgi:putative inorganic carbon (hco3(-)) transporter